jgi:hypothetical protein
MAVDTRISLDADYNVLTRLGTSIDIFIDILIAFQQHAVLLYIAHQRGFLFRASQGKAVKPLAAQLWKRILDWALVAITLLLLISITAIIANEENLIGEDKLNLAGYNKYADVGRGFSHAITGMIVILAIDVFVTLLTLWLAQRRLQFRDPVSISFCNSFTFLRLYQVITKLLAFAFPFVAAYAIERLVLEIYLNVVENINEYSLQLAEVIIEGICRLGLTAAVISTMVAPGVQWIPAAPEFPAQYSNHQYGWQLPGHNLAHQQQAPPQPYSIPMNVNHS